MLLCFWHLKMNANCSFIDKFIRNNFLKLKKMIKGCKSDFLSCLKMIFHVYCFEHWKIGRVSKTFLIMLISYHFIINWTLLHQKIDRKITSINVSNFLSSDCFISENISRNNNLSFKTEKKIALDTAILILFEIGKHKMHLALLHHIQQGETIVFSLF